MLKLTPLNPPTVFLSPACASFEKAFQGEDVCTQSEFHKELSHEDQLEVQVGSASVMMKTVPDTLRLQDP